MGRIEQLERLVGGKRVLVLGAAPFAANETLLDADVVVACNGGIGHLPAGAPVACWSVNARESIIQSKAETNRVMMAQGAGRSIGLAILHTRGGDSGVAAFMRVMRGQQTTIGEHVSLESYERRALGDVAYEGSLMRGQVISNGVLTVALCCSHGASKVLMQGFSWKVGYHYPTKTKVESRGHVSADKGGMSNLLRRYPGVIETTLVVPRTYTGADMVREQPQVERIIVRAKSEGFYGGHRRRVDSEFEVLHRTHVRGWMEIVQVMGKTPDVMRDGEPAYLKEVGNG